MNITPSNDAVLVRLEHRSPHEPHAIGTVVDRGGGVPWLNIGGEIMYPVAEATEVWVDRSVYSHVRSRSAQGAGVSPTQEPIYLINQRNVMATISRGTELDERQG